MHSASTLPGIWHWILWLLKISSSLCSLVSYRGSRGSILRSGSSGNNQDAQAAGPGDFQATAGFSHGAACGHDIIHKPEAHPAHVWPGSKATPQIPCPVLCGQPRLCRSMPDFLQKLRPQGQIPLFLQSPDQFMGLIETPVTEMPGVLRYSQYSVRAGQTGRGLQQAARQDRGQGQFAVKLEA